MKKLIYFILIVWFLSFKIAHGQITTQELPVSYKLNIPVLKENKKTMKVLPSINMAKIEQEDIEDEAKGIPSRFGYRGTNSVWTGNIKDSCTHPVCSAFRVRYRVYRL